MMHVNPQMVGSIGTIRQLANWKLGQPETQQWIKDNHISEDNCNRIIMKMLQGAVYSISQYTGQQDVAVVHDIMYNNNNVLYGICDSYHTKINKMIPWVTKYLNNISLNKNPKDKAIKQYSNVLDYYGKTGEFSIKIASQPNNKCRITYVDQNPWFDYAKFRFRLSGKHYTIESVEATPDNPRPYWSEDKYGFINNLEVMLTASEDWMKWIEKKLMPYGLIATAATLPFKKVAQLDEKSFIYQYIPDEIN
jgi:hypothetical protein